MTGANGVTGFDSFRIKDSWATTGVHNLSSSMDMFYIKNIGTSDLTFTINNVATTIKTQEEFLDCFDKFTQVTVTAISSFDAKAGTKFGPLTATVKDYFSGSSDISRSVPSSFFVVISNDGASPLSYVVNNISINVEAGDLKEALFDPFTQITVKTAVPFRAYLKGTPVVVTDTTAPTVIITPASGLYSSSQTVSVFASEPATIYYTTDGSTPTISSAVYSTPIMVSSSSTVKAIAIDMAGNITNPPTSAIYTINILDTTPPNPISGLQAGTPTSNTIPLTWVASVATDVAHYEIYYSTDGTNFTLSGQVTGTSYVVSGLNPSTFYMIKVITINKSNNSSTGNPILQLTTTAIESVLAADSFTRTDTVITTDSATTLGTTEVGGKTWINSSIYWNYGIKENKAYQQRSNNGGNRYRTPVMIPLSALNYAVEVTLSVIDTLGAGNESVHFRISAGVNLNVFHLTVKGNYALFKTPYGGSETPVGYLKPIPSTGDKVRIESYQDGRIRIFINGVLQHDVKDTYLATTSARVGFAAETFVGRFDDFKVVQLSQLPADTTPPGEVTALTASGITQTGLILSWTQPLDKDFYACEIYNGTTLVGTNIPGSTASMTYTAHTLTGLEANTQYTFTVKTKDWYGNVSTGTSITRSTSL